MTLSQQRKTERIRFLGIYDRLKIFGDTVAPKGVPTLELLNFNETFSPFERFVGFATRGLKLSYIREELKWYLKGDKSDLSIQDHASIWADMIEHDEIQSNYGAYLFTKSAVEFIVSEFTNDPHTRRAFINIHGIEHNFVGARDVPCTMQIGFMVRNWQLHTFVNMRSQDAIYGFGNDLPFFQVVADIYWAILNDHVFNRMLRRGPLHLNVASFHIYERHFEMIDSILVEPEEVYRVMTSPTIFHADEALYLIGHQGVNPNGNFTQWLYESS